VPLRHLEELARHDDGRADEDVMAVAETLLMIPNFASTSPRLAARRLSLSALLEIALGMSLHFFGAISYRLLIAKVYPPAPCTRGGDKLFAHFRALTEGVKELKLHRSARGRFLSDCIQTTTEIFRGTTSRRKSVSSWRKLSQLLFFGAARPDFISAAVARKCQPARAQPVTFVIALWLIGPLTGVLGVLSAFAGQMWRWKKSRSSVSRSPRTQPRNFRRQTRK